MNIIVIILIIILLFCVINSFNVKFEGFNNDFAYWDLPLSVYGGSLRDTRNMSYDLRGDIPNPYFATAAGFPWLLPERIPYRNYPTWKWLY